MSIAARSAKTVRTHRLITLDPLEPRRLMAYGDWPVLLNLDDVWTQYPWLNGGTNSIAVVDKGIDYFHPQLGGNQGAGTVAPRIVNVFDYRDNDNTPFPSESDVTDPSSAHGTGVAGLLIAVPWTDGNFDSQQGVLQSANSKIYNLRTDRFNSQATTELALQWVVANRVANKITAVHLTDFIGGAGTLAYSDELATLKAAGVFIITPVANDWIVPGNMRAPIGNPASDPSVFGAGGIIPAGTLRAQTQRGPGLDIVGPAQQVTLPYYKPQTNQHQLLTGTNDPASGGSGNSWAAPYILGVAVMLQQIDPTLTPDEIMTILQTSGVPTADPDPVSNPSGTIFYARLDALAAVQMAYAQRDDASDQVVGGNDLLANATPITLTDGDGSIAGQELLLHDDDFYGFIAPAGKDFTITIDYAGPTAFPTAQLLDASGTLVAAIPQGGLTRTLAAGNYYIKVTSDVTLSGVYGVTLDAENTPIVVPGIDGTFNTIAYDSAGKLNFAWFDSVAGKLKFSARASTTWSTVQIVDAAAGTGQFMTMALDSTGKPGLAYYDEANTALKYAHFNGTTWDVESVDADFTTGYYPSLKYGNGDRPVIAYYYKSSGDLRFAAFDGSGWQISTIDYRGDVGRYPSLALNPVSGRWGIAYEKSTTGDFRFAEQGKGGVWSITVVDDSTQYAGGFTSLAYTVGGLPAFSYYDAFNADLKYARYNGSKWVRQTVASKNSQGLYTNLILDPANSQLPVIYYFNKTGNSAMVARNNGAGWDFEVAAAGGGRHTSLALTPDDFETFTYLDEASGDLLVIAPS